MTVLVTGFGMIVALGLFSAIGTNLLFYLRHTSHPRWLGTFIFLFLVVYILIGATTFWAAGLLQGEPSLFRRADLPKTSRGDAAAATWMFGGDESRRRRGHDVDNRWR